MLDESGPAAWLVPVNAGNDASGNPRRGWCVHNAKGVLAGFVHDRDGGYRQFRELRGLTVMEPGYDITAAMWDQLRGKGWQGTPVRLGPSGACGKILIGDEITPGNITDVAGPWLDEANWHPDAMNMRIIEIAQGYGWMPGEEWSFSDWTDWLLITGKEPHKWAQFGGNPCEGGYLHRCRGYDHEQWEAWKAGLAEQWAAWRDSVTGTGPHAPDLPACYQYLDALDGNRPAWELPPLGALIDAGDSEWIAALADAAVGYLNDYLTTQGIEGYYFEMSGGLMLWTEDDD